MSSAEDEYLAAYRDRLMYVVAMVRGCEPPDQSDQRRLNWLRGHAAGVLATGLITAEKLAAVWTEVSKAIPPIFEQREGYTFPPHVTSAEFVERAEAAFKKADT